MEGMLQPCLPVIKVVSDSKVSASVPPLFPWLQMWKALKGKLGWWSFEISAACIFDYSVTAVAGALPLLRDLPQLCHTCGLWSEPLVQRGTSTRVIGCHSNRYWEVMDSLEAEDVMDYGTTLPHSLHLSLWMPRWISQLMRQCPPQVMELCVDANRGMPFGSSVHSDEFPAPWPLKILSSWLIIRA